MITFAVLATTPCSSSNDFETNWHWYVCKVSSISSIAVIASGKDSSEEEKELELPGTDESDTLTFLHRVWTRDFPKAFYSG